MMTTKAKIVLWLTLLIAAFLFGLVPQYLQKQQLRGELIAANERMGSVERNLKMAELRDLAGLMLLEVLRHNYGSAKDYSSSYFDKVRKAAENPQNESQKKGLEEILANQDSLTSALAQADPASLSQVQMLAARTYEITR